MDFLIFKAPMLMVQASLDGILLGILFALIAYGMALQWGVMNIINIAQGDLVILGGYIAYTMYLVGIHPAWGVIVSPIIMYFVGVLLYKLVINKVVDRDLFISILATFGIAIVFAINANKIPRRIPSNEAWTINIGALKIRKSIKFVKLIKEKPLEN